MLLLFYGYGGVVVGKLGGIVVALIIAGVAISFKYSNKSDTSDDTRQQVTALLATLPDYDQAQDYYEGLCDVHHEAAFEAEYKMGGRRTSASFDSDAYIHDLLKRMAADAKQAGHSQQAEHLATLEQGVYTEYEGG